MNFYLAASVFVLMTSFGPAWAACDDDGGVVGGGGNVLNATPPTSSQSSEATEHLIAKSRGLLKLFLLEKEADFTAGRLEGPTAYLYTALFRSRPPIAKRLSALQILISERDACRDSFGNAVDGSVYVPQRDSFCLSAYSISKKVIIREVPVQATALMLHEFAELEGLNDEQAVLLQIDAIKNLSARLLGEVLHPQCGGAAAAF